MTRSTGPVGRSGGPGAAVLHAAETGIGGINSMIIGLGESQVDQYGAGTIHVLVPREHAADYDGSRLVVHPFTRRRRGISASLAFLTRLLALVWHLRPTVVVLHSSIAGALGRIGLVLLRPWRRPIVVYCAHGWAFTMQVSDRGKRAYTLVERSLAPLTSAIVNISQGEHDAALRAGLPERLLHCIPNGTPRPASGPTPSPYSTPPEIIRLLFVGRLDRQKGFDVLLEAMKLLTDRPVHLTVVGAAVVEGVETAELPNVGYVGWLPRTELGPYYAHADALVVPSRWEGFGLVAAEALSHGTPVVASRVGGLASLVEHGIAGFLVAPGSAQDLVATLRGLSSARVRGMREAASRRWREAANIDDMNQQYRRLLESLAAGGPNAPAPAGYTALKGEGR